MAPPAARPARSRSPTRASAGTIPPQPGPPPRPRPCEKPAPGPGPEAGPGRRPGAAPGARGAGGPQMADLTDPARDLEAGALNMPDPLLSPGLHTLDLRLDSSNSWLAGGRGGLGGQAAVPAGGGGGGGLALSRRPLGASF